MEDNFSNFQEQQHIFNRKVVKIEENTVHMIHKLSNDIENQFRDVQYQLVDNIGLLLSYQFEQQWKETIGLLFQPIMEGKIKHSLTPRTITPIELKQILQEHPSLKNTYYAGNIYNFYGAANIAVAQAYLDISTSTLVVHQILHCP